MRVEGLRGHCLRFGEEGEMKEWYCADMQAHEMMGCHQGGTGWERKRTKDWAGKKELGLGRKRTKDSVGKKKMYSGRKRMKDSVGKKKMCSGRKRMKDSVGMK